MANGDLGILVARTDWRLGLLTLGISIGALLLWLWVSSPVLLVVGVFGLLVGVWAVLDRRIKLRVDEIGVWYARWGTTVQWGEIEAIETRTLRGTEQVCVVPKSPERIIERMPPWCRLTSWLTERGWSSRFVLSTTSLEQGTPALLDFLRRYHRVRSGATA